MSPVREAFQSVLGKATVFGLAAQAASVAAQPVGFAAARQAANERIQNLQNQVDQIIVRLRFSALHLPCWLVFSVIQCHAPYNSFLSKGVVQMPS